MFELYLFFKPNIEKKLVDFNTFKELSENPKVQPFIYIMTVTQKFKINDISSFQWPRDREMKRFLDLNLASTLKRLNYIKSGPTQRSVYYNGMKEI